MLTIDSGVVGLHVSALDFAIFDHQCIALAAVLTEDGGAVEREVKLFGECTGWIAQEADLRWQLNISMGADGNKNEWGR